MTENSSQRATTPGQAALAEAWEAQAEYCAMKAAGYREDALTRDQARVYTAREVALRECARELRNAVASDQDTWLQPLADDAVPAEVRDLGRALGASGWAVAPEGDTSIPMIELSAARQPQPAPGLADAMDAPAALARVLSWFAEEAVVSSRRYASATRAQLARAYQDGGLTVPEELRRFL